MTIEIHKPELEALILDRMKSGAFQNVEDVLIQALKSSPPSENAAPRKPKKNLAQFLLESPLRGSGLRLARQEDYPRPLDLLAGFWSTQASFPSSSGGSPTRG